MNSGYDLLFARVCDGLATAEEISELHRLLCSDVHVLDAWIHYSALHGDLASGTAWSEVATAGSARAEDEVSALRDWDQRRLFRRFFWFQWLPQAAAGLVLGLFAASIVWAYVGLPAVKARVLLEEDFEGGDAALAARTLLETGIWRGDAAEIVSAQDGIVPSSGQKMMRFRREDFDGRPKPDGGHIAVVYRLIDLRPFRAEFADGAGVVEVSAGFNAILFPDDEKYGAAISLYALDAESLPDRVGRLGSTLANDALAMARSSNTKLDRATDSWQRLTTELRLPPNSEFLVVRLHISQGFRSRENAVFTGSYAEDIRVALTRRAPLP